MRDVPLGVAEGELLVGGRPALAGVAEPLEQEG